MPESSLRRSADLGFGLGLRTDHYEDILAREPAVDWFEVLTENYLVGGGKPLDYLMRIRARYPVVMHGVSMSIGTVDPVDREYLRKLSELAKRVNARWVSDHLCWCGVAGRNMHDLLPLPYSEECLAHCIRRVKMVQEILERPLVLENPSSYVEFRSSSMTEWEFLARLAGEADCGLLLDVNNVYVSSFNHAFDPFEYIEGIPAERVAYYHLAGHTNKGTHIVDTHSDHAIEAVWKLYERACEISGGRSTLYEWDEDIPAFPVVHAEALKAKKRCEKALRRDVARVG